MGKSLRSKRMRKNRIVKRVRNDPRVTEKLKQAIAFEYNEQTEKAHLSMFHDIMNGPAPAVPGLEPGSKIARAHLTEGHVSVDRISNFYVGKLGRLWEAATRAVTKGARQIPDPPSEGEEEKEKMDDKEPRVFDPKTMKDQYGNYPIWMNRKKIQSRAHACRVQKSKDRKKARKISTKKAPKVTDVEMAEKNVDGDDSGEESEMEIFYK